MCGIIGIASYRDISKKILESLKKLEYRGYDSAGISTIYNEEIVENKCAGKVSDLEKLIKKKHHCRELLELATFAGLLMEFQIKQMLTRIPQKKFQLFIMELLKILQLLKKN